MNDRVVAIGAGLLVVLLALLAMGALHERHYKDRRSRILTAQLEGLHLRMGAVEEILREDRLT